MMTMHTDVHKGYLSYKVLIVRHSYVTLSRLVKDLVMGACIDYWLGIAYKTRHEERRNDA